MARFRTESAGKPDAFARPASHLLAAIHNRDLQVLFAVAAIGLLLTAALARAFPIADVLNLIGQLD